MYKYKCEKCQNSFVTNYKKRSEYKGVFCSRKCYNQNKVEKNKGKYTLKCLLCGKEKTTRKWPSENRKFCSNTCRTLFMREHPEKFASKEFTSLGQLFANTPEAVRKGLETKYKNGTLTNWKNNKDWKKYYREVNRLTKLIREEMLKEWDGYDYYSGLYIKDLLSLPHYDKNYPTLDHIKPRSQGFEEGLTPREITSKENLVWTTRSNNSKKGNKKKNNEK
jgi:endogenous inhibitor of DNA gyrase (YacG/DUF329 family)